MSYISNMKEVILQHYEKTKEVDGSVKYLWVDNKKIYISLYLTSTTKNITDVVYNDSDYVGLTFDDTVNKDNKDNYRMRITINSNINNKSENTSITVNKYDNTQIKIDYNDETYYIFDNEYYKDEFKKDKIKDVKDPHVIQKILNSLMNKKEFQKAYMTEEKDFHSYEEVKDYAYDNDCEFTVRKMELDVTE